MTLKKHTDNARAFTFRHEFETVDHANVTLLYTCYMVERMNNRQIDITISKNEANNAYTMLIDYVSDSNLSEPFNRVCDSFEGYSKGCSEAQIIKRLGYLSAFKLLKKVDIKRPNYGKMLENVGMVARGIKRP